MNTILQMRKLLKALSYLPKIIGLIRHEAGLPGQISLTPNLGFSVVSFPISLQEARLGVVKWGVLGVRKESSFRRGQTQSLKKHLKMPPGERQKTASSLSFSHADRAVYTRNHKRIFERLYSES